MHLTQNLQQAIALLQKNQEELTDYLVEKSEENPLIEVTRTLAPVTSSGAGSVGKNIDAMYENLPAANSYSSLYEYLIDQIHLNYRKTPIRDAMFFLVDYMDHNGYLTVDLKEIMEKTGEGYLLVLDALTLLQQLDPAGIGARDLKECLMLQTERDPEAPALAYVILEENFEDLADRKWQKIADKFQISLQDVQEVMDYIQTLSPAPGSHFGVEPAAVVIPEVEVKVEDNQLQVSYLKTGLPRLKFQESYYQEMKAKDDTEVNRYLKEKKQEFSWLEQTILQREETIEKVANEIITQQRDFFFDETRPLKPLTLKMVANAVNIHESTVSRAVNGKFMKTPFGIFELRTFFATAISGQSASDQEIKKTMIDLISQEDKKRPYSDEKISELLKEKEIKISRRTVTKYRESLGIPTSSKRKRY